MIKQLFLNIPVADVPRSVAFFEALGFAQNPQFSDGSGAAACIVLNDAVSMMLATHAKFREFTPKAVCDTSKAVEVLFNLACESREEVDALVAKALAAGGSTYDKPEDFGFMYTHSFVDPDGHGWGLFHMTAPPPEA
jgi:predicted lactoylglutathione lyase